MLLKIQIVTPQAWKEITNNIMSLSLVIPTRKERMQESVLDKVRAEIEALPKTYPFVNHFDMYVKVSDVEKIIDKYREETESD